MTQASLTSPSHATAALEPRSDDFEDFIYLISHDVRNSVRALIELPQWIEEDLAESGVVLEGSVRGHIELMNRHTARLDRMLMDLLTYSRLGRMQAVEAVDLEQSMTTLRSEIVVPEGFVIQQDLKQPTVFMGERDVMTLLQALVGNAIKHHDRHSGLVTVSTHFDGGEIVLTVEDDGPGIPADFHDRVFGVMTTLRPRDEVEGSGMGLAFAQKIAGIYGGRISITSDGQSRGTRIEFRLPQRQWAA